MGSVALLTREGEVKIAKEIEEGEKEIVQSCMNSAHALVEISKLKEKVTAAEDQHEFVKDLVRGLDDESTKGAIEKVRKKIFEVCEDLEKELSGLIKEDGTLAKPAKSQEKKLECARTIPGRPDHGRHYEVPGLNWLAVEWVLD